MKSISLYFVYPLAMFFLGFFSHMAYVEFFYPNRYTNQVQKPAVYEEEAVTQVAETPGEITTCDTRYVVIEYDLEKEKKESSTGQLPEKYLGMTRDKLQEALEEYEMNPTLEDQEKGFLSLQLEKFSEDQVVVQKNYRPIEKTVGYYLMVQDGKIVVMEEDQQTVYLTTEIYAEALSDSLKQELIMGKFIHNIDELYGFLESYTS
ncbi:MAG: hypothetical protein PUI46_08405 [Lachnospiraceae bacterium]|nr:hypothetical protein [Lachnospiraceae bacterium]MDY5700196.1 hypothetical protein [Lachnospiraceae bacterium]